MKLQDGLFGTPSGLIMDPVHGGIPFFDHEAKVIRHPLFQRLRHILQNDMLFMVFPGATHNRFQHSIGTMHIAGNYFKNIVKSYLIDSIPKRKDRIKRKQNEAIQYFYFCVRLAALLHDVGHAPFSHQFENCEAIKNIIADERFLKIWEGEQIDDYYEKNPNRIDHSNFSVRCAHQIFKDISFGKKFDIQPIDVLRIMETTDRSPSERFQEYSSQVLSIFMNKHELPSFPSENFVSEKFQSIFKEIISGELDADKMDYLLRDSYFSGCKYGIYNIDHLLHTIKVGFDFGEPWFGLAIMSKGIGALEDFVNSRFQLYNLLYSHKVVIGFDWLLNRAICDLMNEEFVRDQISEAISDINKFKEFTDYYFWQEFYRVGRKSPRSAASRLIQREKIEYLYTGKNLAKFEKTKIMKKLAEKHKCKIIFHESETKFSKISNTYQNLRVLAKDEVSGAKELGKIVNHSEYFNKYQDIMISHFYKDPFDALD